MKFGIKGLAALVGSLVIMSAMAATPASACHAKRSYHYGHSKVHFFKHHGHKHHRHHRRGW